MLNTNMRKMNIQTFAECFSKENEVHDYDLKRYEHPVTRTKIPKSNKLSRLDK